MNVSAIVRRSLLVAAVVLRIAIGAIPAGAVIPPGDLGSMPEVTIRASVNTAGERGTGQTMGSDRAAMSEDGRFVVFDSDASNLVDGDTNGESDVFVHDNITGETTRVSVNAAGEQAREGGWSPSISDDGRFVAFVSWSDDLVEGDTNGKWDVFVHDRATGALTRASVTTQGAPADDGNAAVISGDGNHVVFYGEFSGVAGWPARGIYVRDLVDGTTELVPTPFPDAPPVYSYGDPAAISADGRFVAYYEANAVTGFQDIFVYDRVEASNTTVSVSSSDEAGNGHSLWPSISADGRYVAFASEASNLVANDTNGMMDVFVHDRQTLTTTRESVSNEGAEGDHDSARPSISSDGSRVAFESLAGSLVRGQVASDVMVRDRTRGLTGSVSLRPDGGLPMGGSGQPSISGDGAYVAFSSQSVTLVPGEWEPDVMDVYVTPVDITRTAVLLKPWMVSNPALPYDNNVFIDGELLTSGWGMAGKTVILQTAAPGGTFADSSLHAKTVADGSFEFVASPSKKTLYRVRFAGASPFTPSFSDGTFYVWPRTYVRTPIAPSTMSHSRYYTVYGYLKPRHTSGTYPVRIYKWRYESGAWKEYGYVSAKASNYSSYSKYSRSIKLPYKGRWRLKAYAPEDSKHAASWSSGSDYVTVN